jgi:hypothetical protein
MKASINDRNPTPASAARNGSRAWVRDDIGPRHRLRAAARHPAVAAVQAAVHINVRESEGG